MNHKGSRCEAVNLYGNREVYSADMCVLFWHRIAVKINIRTKFHITTSQNKALHFNHMFHFGATSFFTSIGEHAEKKVQQSHLNSDFQWIGRHIWMNQILFWRNFFRFNLHFTQKIFVASPHKNACILKTVTYQTCEMVMTTLFGKTILIEKLIFMVEKVDKLEVPNWTIINSTINSFILFNLSRSNFGGRCTWSCLRIRFVRFIYWQFVVELWPVHCSIENTFRIELCSQSIMLVRSYSISMRHIFLSLNSWLLRNF